MNTTYMLFKFLHIAGAIVWLGGVFTLGIINARLARQPDRAAAGALARQGSFFGQYVAGPAALLTLVAGMVMVAAGGLNFTSLWILWGFAGIIGSMALGIILIRPVNQQLTELAQATFGDEPRLRQLQRRLSNLNLINLALLLSVVFAMVFKPAL